MTLPTKLLKSVGTVVQLSEGTTSATVCQKIPSILTCTERPSGLTATLKLAALPGLKTGAGRRAAPCSIPAAYDPGCSTPDTARWETALRPRRFGCDRRDGAVQLRCPHPTGARYGCWR